MFAKLGFTCSAGVAENKVLAKIASAMRKPNKVTMVPRSHSQQLMNSIPFNRVQGFGGKLGHQLTESFDVKTVGDILNIDKEQLIARFGGTNAQWMRSAAAGQDSDPVLNR